MTREELEALGMDDDKLRELYEQHLGRRPAVDGMTDALRGRLYETLKPWLMGAIQPGTGEPIGSFAVDFPEQHGGGDPLSKWAKTRKP